MYVAQRRGKPEGGKLIIVVFPRAWICKENGLLDKAKKWLKVFHLREEGFGSFCRYTFPPTRGSILKSILAERVLEFYGSSEVMGDEVTFLWREIVGECHCAVEEQKLCLIAGRK